MGIMAGLTNKQKKEWAYTEYVITNLSQKEAAAKVGVSVVTMSKWVKEGMGSTGPHEGTEDPGKHRAGGD